MKIFYCVQQVKFSTPLEAILSELIKPSRRQHLSSVDLVRIARSLSKIGFHNHQISLAAGALFDNISLSTLLGFSVLFFEEFVRCVRSNPSPSMKLSNTLKQAVSMRGWQLGRRTLHNVDEMFTIALNNQRDNG